MLPKMSFLDSFDEFDGGVYEADAEQTQMITDGQMRKCCSLCHLPRSKGIWWFPEIGIPPNHPF